MALDVEGVLDGGANGQEPLGCSQLLEALHLAHTSSSRLMRILGAIALAQALLMASRQSDFGLHRTLRAKPIGHQNIKREALFLKQLAHEFHGRSLVAPPLDKKVETSPSSSTARQSQNCRPAIVTAISSRCQRAVGRGRRRRSSRANNGPNFKTHHRTIS
jgi:hypothetical protein